MEITDLVLPILLSTVLVFLASFLVWMVFPHHKKDWKKIANEDEFMDAIRAMDLGDGNFSFPHCTDGKTMQSEAYQRRWEKGPTGFLTLRPAGKFSMNKNLAQWIVYCLAISIFVAYMVSRYVPKVPSQDESHLYLETFRMAGTAAFLGYSGAVIPQGIWKNLNWPTVWREVLDGLLYALLTAGSFGWLAQ